MSYQQVCKDKYVEVFDREYLAYLKRHKGKNAAEDAEREAQRRAIEQTLGYGIEKCRGKHTVQQIWRCIRKAHIERKVGIPYGSSVEFKDEVVEKVISAHQSWGKSSGHAFEAYIPDSLNAMLGKHHIVVVLQKELTAMLNSKPTEICNNDDDVKWLDECAKNGTFDLYAIEILNGEKYVFGCIQTKTSIRERVGTDRWPSQEAMERGFWSVAVTLDGTFFKGDKFRNMVNGGGNYKQNGWHGAYVCESPIYEGRLYEFDNFVEDANKAAKVWRSDRKSLTCSWNVADVK